VVHVLLQLHRSLRPNGFLLDVHPLPRHPLVEVRRGGRRLPLGALDDTVGIRNIRAARGRLRAVLREGSFRVEARRWFDQFMHFGSVEAWLRRREERDSTSLIPPGLLDRAEAEMRRPGSTLVIQQRVGATRLRKAPAARPA
jgi:hypothetical protein